MIDAIAAWIGSGEAADAQKQAANNAMGIQRDMFNQIRADNQPWRDAGVQALGKMQDADYMRDFTANDFQQDPGYMFRMQEGQKALERSAAARGGLMSGGALKAITQYGQDFGSNEYQKAYDRFNADRDRRFGRLSTLSGQGQAATGAMSQAAQNYANGASEAMYGIGNADAAKWNTRTQAIKDWQAQDRQMAGQAMGMFSMCDERLKENIKPLTKEQVSELRSTIRPYFFTYKNEKHGKGQFIGPLAQELEKSQLGKTLVFTDRFGNKQVDLGRAVLLLLALEASDAA